ncbi:hypothetical protein B0H10DRAFT_1965483 [Mycena sp. CBHHK59/15]|nr:hypothetical protein B0H10DRAFT_1965483 [Mycena sp. CBHHK59/15]
MPWLETPDGQKIVKQAWRKCEVLGTEWNLSTECLTSKASEKALLAYLREDTALTTEIANRCGAATHLVNVLTSALEPATDQSADSTVSELLTPEEAADFNSHDDSDVPLAAVVKDSLDININPASYTEEFTVSRTACTHENDGVTTNDSTEDVWAYMDNGLRWDEVSELQVVDTD